MTSPFSVSTPAIAAESEPGLSSVHIDFSMLAERALAELHRQLSGVVPTPAEPVLVPSCFVKERSSTQTRQHGDPVLRRAQAIIDRSLPKGLSVAALAERLKLSTDHLAWCCKTRLGTTPGRWIRRQRLACARSLLGKRSNRR